jgi:hypothetical protein
MLWFVTCKVEKILKGSLDSIPSPSPSVKNQIIGRKVCLRCKCKTLLGVGSAGRCQQTFEDKKFVDPAIFFLITSSKLSCQ